MAWGGPLPSRPPRSGCWPRCGSWPGTCWGRWRRVGGRWVLEIVAGRAVVAFGLSEPAAGSDAAGLELQAEPDGDGFRLSGTKAWISNAPEADVYTLFARTTPGARSRGITAFAVPGDAPGLGGEALELLAPHAIGRLELDGVRVGPEQVLGRV